MVRQRADSDSYPKAGLYADKIFQSKYLCGDLNTSDLSQLKSNT